MSRIKDLKLFSLFAFNIIELYLFKMFTLQLAKPSHSTTSDYFLLKY